MASDFASRLGQEVARRRKDRQLTQEALAERVKTSPEWVSQLERGRGHPSFPLLERLSWEFGITVDELLVSSARSETRNDAVTALAAVADGLAERDVRLLLALAQEMGQTDTDRPARGSRRSRRKAA